MSRRSTVSGDFTICINIQKKGFQIVSYIPSVKGGLPPKIKLKHVGTDEEAGCGKEFPASLAAFRRDSYCRRCENSTSELRKTQKIINSIRYGFTAVKLDQKNNYVYLNHKKCGNTFLINVDVFKRKYICPCCEGFDMRLAISKLQKTFNKIRPGFRVLSIRKDANTSYPLIRCPCCDSEYEMKIKTFRKYPFCPQCGY